MTTGPARAFDFEFVLDRLAELYHTGDWRVPYLRDHAENPFQVLIGTILSQRTRDEATDVASARLFAKYPDAPGLARADPKTLARLIRPVNFYPTKARAIRDCAREIVARFGGEVPRSMEELLSLPHVGPKTANCVLVFGYGLPAIPVDTHVHRIANRWGIVRTRTPEETERRLREVVPSRYWIPLNPLLVQHGQNVCRPIGPKCGECPIATVCATGIALTEGRAPPRPEDRPRGPRSAAARPGRGGSRPSPPRGTPSRRRTIGRRPPTRTRTPRRRRRSTGSS
ncbi:MAG TPA: endonuclease III [Thermoplasmata archaeon]|nr:endonuclease III [Thermoplasmata archaeon]